MSTKQTNVKELNVFKELDKAVQVLGVERLVDFLKIFRNNPVTVTEKDIEDSLEIIQIVCDEFNMSLKDFHGTSTKNDRRYAVGIVAYFLSNRLNISNINISFILKKPEPLISIYKKEITRLNPSHPTDIPILSKIENIKNKFKPLG